MRILVTGANGQLDYDVMERLKKSDINYLGTDIDTLDIVDKDEIEKLYMNIDQMLSFIVLCILLWMIKNYVIKSMF